MRHGRGRSFLTGRFGLSTTQRIAKRLHEAKPFSIFIIEDDLRCADYLGARHYGLIADHGHAIVGTYVDMPSWSELAADIEATLSALAKAGVRAAAGAN